MAIRASIIGKIEDSAIKIHRRGRAITWSIKLGAWTHFSAVHVDVTEPMAQRKRLLTAIHSHCAQRGGRSFLLGDFNFVVSGESRMQGNGTQTVQAISQDQLADHFETVFHDHCELLQHDFTFRRLAKDSGGCSTIF